MSTTYKLKPEFSHLKEVIKKIAIGEYPQNGTHLSQQEDLYLFYGECVSNLKKAKVLDAWFENADKNDKQIKDEEELYTPKNLELKCGYVVQLKSGGALMTIKKVIKEGLQEDIICNGFDKNNVAFEAKFYENQLVRIKPSMFE
jgi:uncharacterized protein YodC (DUF2158 family)